MPNEELVLQVQTAGQKRHLNTSGHENKFESERTRKKYAFVHQAISVSALNLSQLALGTVLGFSATLAPFLQEGDDNYVASNADVGWIVAAVPLGQILGSLISGPLCGLLGRRAAILIAAVPTAAGWALMATLTPEFTPLIVGRLLSGVGIGLSGVTVPAYACELAEPGFRGTLAASGPIVVTAGILLAYILGSFVHWQIESAVLTLFPILTFCCVVWIPESPSWLMAKGKFDQAREAVSRLKRAEDEIKITEAEIAWHERHKKNPYVLSSEQENVKPIVINRKESLFSREILFPFFIVNGIFVLSNLSGFVVVVFYGVKIFQVLGASCGSAALSRLGRRPLLAVSGLLSALFMGLLALTVYVQLDSIVFGWLPLLWLLLFTLAFMCGMGCVPWLLLGEMIPAAHQSLLTAMSGILIYGSMAFSSFAFPFLAAESALGVPGTFTLYSLMCALTTVFALLLLPETKGKTLVQIEAMFQQSEEENQAEPQFLNICDRPLVDLGDVNHGFSLQGEERLPSFNTTEAAAITSLQFLQPDLFKYIDEPDKNHDASPSTM